jgi:hypothetical protein
MGIVFSIALLISLEKFAQECGTSLLNAIVFSIAPVLDFNHFSPRPTDQADSIDLNNE